MGCRQYKLRNVTGLILKLRIIVAVQELKISFYEQILVPPLFLPNAPSLHLLWQRHCLNHNPKPNPNFNLNVNPYPNSKYNPNPINNLKKKKE